MKNIKIHYLSSIGFSNYFITENCQLYCTASEVQKEVKKDKNGKFYLKNDNGEYKRISAKKIFGEVFGIQLCEDNIENLKNEIWKEIKGTNGKYFVSNYGRIKSYCKNEAIILKPYQQNRGYLEVKIKRKNLKIHQLVAEAFCENRYKGTETKTEIHHKNGIRLDNRSDNLEILSIEEHHKIHNKKEAKEQ